MGKGVCNEETPHGQPFGPYSHAKQAQEHLAKEFQQQDLDIAILRLANIYGPGSKLWVDELCRELKRGTPALLNGGDFNASLTHVDNVVEMILCTAASPHAYGQIYNIADEEQVSWRTYCTALAKIIGTSPPRSIPKPITNLVAIICEGLFRLFQAKRRPPLTREAVNLVGSPLHIPIDKAKREVGYRPIKDYQTSIVEIQAYLTATQLP